MKPQHSLQTAAAAAQTGEEHNSRPGQGEVLVPNGGRHLNLAAQMPQASLRQRLMTTTRGSRGLTPWPARIYLPRCKTAMDQLRWEPPN